MDQPGARTNHLGQPIGAPVTGWLPRSRPAREVIPGRYCRLEPLGEHHIADLWEAYGHDFDRRNWTYLSHGPYATMDDFKAFMGHFSQTADPMFFAVLSGDTEPRPFRATGVAAFLRIAPDDGSIEVGHINFSPLLQRTAAATEAMYLMMKHAFDLGYRRYEWKCDALNAPSRAAAQRLGLSFEGIFRQATVYKGRNRDTAWYAAVDSEWPALRGALEEWLDPANFDDEGRQRVRLSELTAPVVVARG